MDNVCTICKHSHLDGMTPVKTCVTLIFTDGVHYCGCIGEPTP